MATAIMLSTKKTNIKRTQYLKVFNIPKLGPFNCSGPEGNPEPPGLGYVIAGLANVKIAANQDPGLQPPGVYFLLHL